MMWRVTTPREAMRAGRPIGGESGADLIFGQGGDDMLRGGSGDDYIEAGSGALMELVITCAARTSATSGQMTCQYGS